MPSSQKALPASGVAAVGGLHHLLDGQAELGREFVVALVVRRHGHDGAGAVGGQHVVRDPDRCLFAVHRVERVGAGERAGLFLAEIGALEVALGARRVLVGAYRRELLGRGDALDERMLGRQHDVGRAEERVGPGGEDLDLFAGGPAVWPAMRKMASAPSERPIQLRCMASVDSGQSTSARSSSKRSA